MTHIGLPVEACSPNELVEPLVAAPAAAAYPSPFIESGARTKNFVRGKIFDFEIFVLKYVSKHSESIPTKKNFRPKFFDFAIFSLFWSFWAKND